MRSDKLPLLLFVLLLVLLFFVETLNAEHGNHGVIVSNKSSQAIDYSVKWLSDSWDQADIPSQDCSLKPGEKKVHSQANNKFSLQLTYTKKKRKKTWSLDTYEAANLAEQKGYAFIDCGQSFCFNQEE